MYKKILVFTDLDGTLLDHFTYQTDDAAEMITRLQLNQIDIIPNSSKTLPEILLLRQQLSLAAPFIIENGAAVYIPVGYFQQQPAATELQGEYWVKSFSQPTAHWLQLLKQHGSAFKHLYQGFSEMQDEQLVALTGLSKKNALMAKQRQFGEPLNWLGDTTQKNEFIQLMRQLGANVLQGGRFLHISGHCDKGQAQQWLTAQYLQHDRPSTNSPSQLPLQQALLQNHHPQRQVLSIALGDGNNDIAMLEQATIAVQIRSPVHDFPPLTRTEHVYQSRLYGPAGWTECLNEILSSTIIY